MPISQRSTRAIPTWNWKLIWKMLSRTLRSPKPSMASFKWFKWPGKIWQHFYHLAFDKPSKKKTIGNLQHFPRIKLALSTRRWTRPSESSVPLGGSLTVSMGKSPRISRGIPQQLPQSLIQSAQLLVVDLPLWKILVSWDDYSHYMEK